MATLQVQSMPDGYAVDAPTFGYWFRAGAALALGAGIVSILGNLAFFLLATKMPALMFLRTFIMRS